MPQTGEPNPPRWSAEESFLELLTDTLDLMDRAGRGQFLQRFFRSIAQLELTETQSLEFWEQALARKRELTESLGKRVALQAALVDVLASAGQLRLRVVDARKIDAHTIMPAYYTLDGLDRVAPAYRGKPILTAEEIEDVVAFLATLQD